MEENSIVKALAHSGQAAKEKVTRALFTQDKGGQVRGEKTIARSAGWLHSPQDDIDELEACAQTIMGAKKAMRPVRTQNKYNLRNRLLDTDDTDQEEVGATGIAHLKKLELVPKQFGKRTEDLRLQDNTMQQARGNTGRKLSFNNSSSRNLQLGEEEEDGGLDDGDQLGPDCNCVKVKVKSGKFAKSNANLIRQEIWPHTAVSRKYMKRTTFDNIEFDAFVAGETRIIHSMLVRGDRGGIGRLKVLSLVAHWYGKSRNWPLVRSLFEGIMDEIESGESEWVDDFMGFETMLPLAIGGGGGVSGTENKVNQKNLEVYWCKPYQTGACDLPAPHMMQIKPDEPAVLVVHICAYCWTIFRHRKDHMEMDCAAKK